jgi:archaemetzincin
MALKIAIAALVAATSMDRAASLRAEQIDPRFERLRDLHVPKRAPAPGDWLAEHPERGQSVADYLRERPRPVRGKWIELVLLGDFTPPQREAVRLTADYVERFFGMPVRQLDPVPLGRVPQSARRVRFGHEQILTTWVLHDLLTPSPHALAAIALSAADLYPDPSWNFVFGQASLTGRVGVWSIFRNGEPGDPAFLRRTLQTAVHELSHMLGIEHCIAYECLMNGSNHQAEKDARPIWLCPLCLAKLSHALGCDPGARFEKLREFAQAHLAAADARYFAEAARRVASL